MGSEAQFATTIAHCVSSSSTPSGSVLQPPAIPALDMGGFNSASQLRMDAPLPLVQDMGLASAGLVSALVTPSIGVGSDSSLLPPMSIAQGLRADPVSIIGASGVAGALFPETDIYSSVSQQLPLQTQPFIEPAMPPHSQFSFQQALGFPSNNLAFSSQAGFSSSSTSAAAHHQSNIDMIARELASSTYHLSPSMVSSSSAFSSLAQSDNVVGNIHNKNAKFAATAGDSTLSVNSRDQGLEGRGGAVNGAVDREMGDSLKGVTPASKTAPSSTRLVGVCRADIAF